MKKCFILFALVSGLFLSGNAQNYQLLNPGFEEWESSNISAEPVHWNSFATSDGAMAMLASTPHHYHRNGGRLAQKDLPSSLSIPLPSLALSPMAT